MNTRFVCVRACSLRASPCSSQRMLADQARGLLMWRHVNHRRPARQTLELSVGLLGSGAIGGRQIGSVLLGSDPTGGDSRSFRERAERAARVACKLALLLRRQQTTTTRSSSLIVAAAAGWLVAGSARRGNILRGPNVNYNSRLFPLLSIKPERGQLSFQTKQQQQPPLALCLT